MWMNNEKNLDKQKLREYFTSDLYYTTCKNVYQT